MEGFLDFLGGIEKLLRLFRGNAIVKWGVKALNGRKRKGYEIISSGR